MVGGDGAPVFALEATGSLHRAWAAELERRWPGSLRLFAPSETQAARAQLGTRRFKTDDRDCAALVWLARQGAGRPGERLGCGGDAGAVAHRRQLILALKPLRQRLHDQLNALAPGLSAPGGSRPRVAAGDAHRAARCSRARPRSPGRAPSAAVAQGTRRRPVERRHRGVLGRALAGLPGAAADAELRAERMARDLDRFDALRADIAFVDDQIEQLLAASPGQVLTTLPGVATIRAAAFAAHTLPVERFPTPEQLYSATGLAPASYESATIRRRGGIARTGLPEHRDALMAIAWGLGQFAPAFQHRRTSSGRAARPASKPESRSPATPADSAGDCSTPNSPTTIGVTIAPGETAGGDGAAAMPHDGAT